MVTVDASTERRDGVTLVTVAVANERTTRQRAVLRVDAETVWPPRRQGVPEHDWDGTEVCVRLDPGERRGLGFATPDAVGESPVTLHSTDRAENDPGPMADTDGVIRTLGDARPPRDAVPTPSVRGVDGGGAGEDDTQNDEADEGDFGEFDDSDDEPPTAESWSADTADAPPESPGAAEPPDREIDRRFEDWGEDFDGFE